MARSISANKARIAADWSEVACDRGDAEGYFRLRGRISALEAEAARLRRSDRRAEALQVLATLKVGDIIDIPAKRHRGWAVVVETGRSVDGPTVLTADRQVKRLSIVDFPEPPTVAGRVKVPKHFDLRSPACASEPNLTSSPHRRSRPVRTPTRWPGWPSCGPN